MKNPSGFSTLLTMLSLTVGSVTSLAANAAISLDDLRNQVRQYIEQQVPEVEGTRWEIQIRGLDPRIKLADCPTPLAFKVSGNKPIARNSTIYTQCFSEQNETLWSLYVPTQIKKMQQAVTSVTSLSAGSIIEAKDVEVTYQDTFMLRNGFFSSTAQVIGSKTRQSVSSNQVLRKRSLCQVCKGEDVIVEATGSGLRIKTAGLALNNGTQGDTVRVQNKRSGRKINAVVVATGKVQINI
ncbi:flagellar basal body P-ring formation protein FlgA [Neiella marina]|uniref:Flagella basal body P-ring formation protein FlgA n=1 Tax=Neiella holothuriorum TaxID=2870530 RepID=A0ABS7EES8_9GAMM|nr:flagellar basal body P-ring formation chaperone FlgA [Neiella holothuriorum]MBW8190847.1 flagellar basal body P-ring formation protein FlgA [Neiella holothuriorum]